MARSVINLHSARFVHKNIRPETVLVTAFGTSYLVGFESFRSASTMTVLVGDAKWEQNLYRHPLRQGEAPEDAYIMQHDVYSLGVCLLEIGMWNSFVKYQEETPYPAVLELVSKDFTRGGKQQAFATKERLLSLAMDRLPSCMGEKYLEVVTSCLTCLDKGSSFGTADIFQDKEGIDVGVRYIETTHVQYLHRAALRTSATEQSPPPANLSNTGLWTSQPRAVSLVQLNCKTLMESARLPTASSSSSQSAKPPPTSQQLR
nr:hypothetical protein CFP56_31754 [Quercus suber]